MGAAWVCCPGILRYYSGMTSIPARPRGRPPKEENTLPEPPELRQFRSKLVVEGMSRHSISAYLSDLHKLAEWASPRPLLGLDHEAR